MKNRHYIVFKSGPKAFLGLALMICACYVFSKQINKIHYGSPESYYQQSFINDLPWGYKFSMTQKEADDHAGKLLDDHVVNNYKGTDNFGVLTSFGNIKALILPASKCANDKLVQLDCYLNAIDNYVTREQVFEAAAAYYLNQFKDYKLTEEPDPVYKGYKQYRWNKANLEIVFHMTNGLVMLHYANLAAFPNFKR